MREKIKIAFFGNFNERSFEGLISLITNLKKHFDKKYKILINKRAGADLIHIHSSGFYESIKHTKSKGKKIYSLYSNIKSGFLNELVNIIQFYIFFYHPKYDHQNIYNRIVRTIFSLTSQLIPVFIKKFFLKKMDVLVLPSDWLYKKLKIKNSQVIRNGIDCGKFKNLSAKTGKFSVGYFGHPSPSKGLMELVKAFSKIKDRNIEKKIYITTNNLRVRNYIRKKDKKIKIHGLVKDIVKEYNKTDVIVLPYKHAGGAIATPLVLLEAMACERAIITTNLPHIREICGDSVVYVDPCSPKQIVTAVNKLKNNPGLRGALGKKARARAIKQYNQEKMFKEYDELYKKILK